MEDLRFEEMFALLAPRWNRALAEKRFRDALMIGLVGFVCARETDGKEFDGAELGCLALVEKTISDAFKDGRGRSLKDESGRPCCSFCGRSAPAVRLVAGATGNICVPCAKVVVDQFGRAPGSSEADEH